MQAAISSKPSRFSWKFLMVYSKMKLKNNEGRSLIADKERKN
jgi:hypothetical protein